MLLLSVMTNICLIFLDFHQLLRGDLREDHWLKRFTVNKDLKDFGLIVILMLVLMLLRLLHRFGFLQEVFWGLFTMLILLSFHQQHIT